MRVPPTVPPSARLTTLRLVLGAVGVLLAGVGVVHLLGQDPADLVDTALWLAGGVVVHDAVLAPLVVVVGAAVVPRLPARSRAPLVVAGVVAGSVLLMALPVVAGLGNL